MHKSFKRSSRFVLASLFLSLFSISEVFAQPDLTLSMNDFFVWAPSTVNSANISNVTLNGRVKYPNYQTIAGLDTNVKVLYSPDGMDNFGPYTDSSNQFNLFNFSHWQNIDILAWFGGTAGTPVLIPAKPWVDAAHKNGVKVIGTVFMAPAAFGGSQTIMQNFLQQDANGNFLAAAKLIEIANYYHFDGWILNFETSVNSATGTLASSFVHKLDSAYSGEVIWYDAMLQSGLVSYQNKLNANNAFFFQNSTGLFTNYVWSSAATVQSSATYATGLSQSPFKVYTGADMWPSRTAQPAFNNYSWIDQIVTGNVAKTSIALFATNFTYNYNNFTNFNNNPADYNTFYATERKLFSGLDQDPFVVDNNAWKGIANYVPVRSTITSFPFQTDFNTGHGMNYYNNGTLLTAGSWHNMSHQAILPSWTFYAPGTTTLSYDFTKAYTGGSSLAVSSSPGGVYSIPLFSTDMITGTNSLNTEIAFNSSDVTVDSVAIVLQKKNSATPAISVFHPAHNNTWQHLVNAQLEVGTNDTIVAIKLNVYASGAFALNIGEIGIGKNAPNAVTPIAGKPAALRVFPNPAHSGIVNITLNGVEEGQLDIFDLAGKKVTSRKLKNTTTEQVTLPTGNVYMYEFTSKQGFENGKIIVE